MKQSLSRSLVFPTLYQSPGPQTRVYGLLHRHHMHIDPPLSQWNSESFGSGRARSLVFPTLSPSPGPQTRGSGLLRRHHMHIDPPLSQWNSESFVSGRARSLVFLSCAKPARDYHPQARAGSGPDFTRTRAGRRRAPRASKAPREARRGQSPAAGWRWRRAPAQTRAGRARAMTRRGARHGDACEWVGRRKHSQTRWLETRMALCL